MALRKSDFGSIWACLLVCMLGFISKAQAQTYQVATPNGLTALEANLAGSGVKRVQFAPGGYSQPGQLSLTASSADSIIFERSAPDTSMVQISSRLLRFEGLTQTKVVLRGLTFKLESPTAELLNGRAAANQRLLIDSCILYADSVNSTFLSWLGTKADIRRSLFVIRKTGASTRIDLEADTVAIIQNLFNFEGYVSGKTLGLISLTRNTVNKTQFNLTTDGSTQYFFEKNLFAYPPSQNRLPAGMASRYPVRILGDFVAEGSAAQSNLRDTTWTGYDLVTGASLFTDVTNSTVGGISGKADSTLWDWRIPTDTARGAWSGPATQALPPHNIFPGQKSLAPVNLQANKRPTFHFAAASIPRYVPFTLASPVSYTIPDSLRSYFDTDEAYTMGAPPTAAFFSLDSLVISNPNTQSTPRLLGASSGNTFDLGPAGAKGSASFASPSTTARILIPVFGAQNTWKGSDRLVKLSNEASLTFQNITRAGITDMLPALSVPDTTLNKPNWKRYRPLLSNSNPAGFGFTSTAVLGLGSQVTFSLPRSGLTTPFNVDSVIAFDGNISYPVTRDTTTFRATITISSQPQGIAIALFEKLALGRGDDTLNLVQGHRILSSKSESGYQFTLDSTATTNADRLPYFDGPMRLFKPSWTGRKIGELLTFEMKKLSQGQAAYAFVPISNGSLDSVLVRDTGRSTSENLVITLNTDDNSKSFLMGRKYSLPRGIYSKWTDGEHSISHLMSSKPGELRVDTTLSSAASAVLTKLLGDSLAVLKQRRISTENLDITEYFHFTVKRTDTTRKDSLRVLVIEGDSLLPRTFVSTPDSLFFTLDSPDREFVVLRRLPKRDTTHSDSTDGEPRLRTLTLSPKTDNLANPNSEKTFKWTYTPDSVKAGSNEGKVRFELCEWAGDTVGAGPKGNATWSDSLAGLAKVDSLGRVTRLKAAFDSPVIYLALRIYSVTRIEISDIAMVALLPKSSSDSITIDTDLRPVIKVVEGQPDKVNIVPNLDTANANKLQKVIVTQISIDPAGKVIEKVDTVVADPVSKGFILTVSDAAITTLKLKYLSTNNLPTEDMTSHPVPLPPGFRAAVNNLAPTLASDRRELIGSPFKVKLGELFPGLNVATKTPAPEIAVYEGGKWNRIDKHADLPNGPSIADVTLDSGKGYLVYLPEGSKPQLPESVFENQNADSLLSSVTVKLVKGWQIITNPKPFAIADADIDLDSSKVSYFCQLKWSGSPLKEDWETRVETLKPFVGYAVYAEDTTSIVFNPRKALAPQGKKATAKFVTLHLQTSWGESGTLTLTDAKTTRAFPKQGFGSRLQVVWKRNQRLILTEAMQPGMNESFSVMGKSQGKMRLSLSDSDLRSAGDEWYVWSPVMGELKSLAEKPEIITGPGWQEYQLLKLAPSSREAEEKRLRSLYPSAFTYRIDFKRGRIAAAVPVGTGVSNSLSLLLFDLNGHIRHQSLQRNLQPGWHEWSLPRLQAGRTTGASFLRLQWHDAQGQQSKLFPLGAQP